MIFGSEYEKNISFDEYYIDPLRLNSRGKSIYKNTPEEFVRLKMINYLHKEARVPLKNIEKEVRLKNGGRADIVVYDSRHKNKKPLLVIECKRDDTPLNYEVRRQAENYCKELGCANFVICNREELIRYRIVKNKSKRIDRKFTFSSLSKNEQPKKNIKRKMFKPFPNAELELYEHLEENVHLSPYSSNDVAFLASILYKSLFDEENHFMFSDLEGIEIKDNEIVEKIKVGNRSSGFWCSINRIIYVQDDCLGLVTLGFSIQAGSNDKTYLMVFMENPKTRYKNNILQLNLDRFTEYNADLKCFEVYHDGSRGGRNKRTLESIKIYFHDSLFTEKGLLIGYIPEVFGPIYPVKKLDKFYLNLIHYCILRRRFDIGEV